MKFDRRGIRFHIWLYFFFFSVAILLLFGVLLNVLIRPYYRNDRINRLVQVAATFEKYLTQDENTNTLQQLNTSLARGNVCALIYNENGRQLYYVDSLGQNCAFRYLSPLGEEKFILLENPQQGISFLKENLRYSQTFQAGFNGNETLIYGQKIAGELANYYLFLNSPLEPVESVLDFIFRQYFYIAAAIVMIAFAVAFYLSKRIAAPIQNLQKEANKLSNRDYNVKVPTSSFTEIDNLASSLKDASTKLSKIEELRKDLMANISHDLKTPLTMIQAYGEMILDLSGNDPEKREEHLHVILKEVAYLNRLINDMQELSQMQAGFIELSQRNFDLAEITEDVLELLQHASEERQMKIHKDLSSLTVYADEVKISQVIYNYILNAIKHTSAGSDIYVRCYEEENNVCFSVRDTGKGITAEDLPYIWDRYQKMDKGFHRQAKGSGLGLAIVKAILEAHHAEYGVISLPNEGATFYFRLSKDYEENED